MKATIVSPGQAAHPHCMCVKAQAGSQAAPQRLTTADDPGEETGEGEPGLCAWRRPGGSGGGVVHVQLSHVSQVQPRMHSTGTRASRGGRSPVLPSHQPGTESSFVDA